MTKTKFSIQMFDGSVWEFDMGLFIDFLKKKNPYFWVNVDKMLTKKILIHAADLYTWDEVKGLGIRVKPANRSYEMDWDSGKAKVYEKTYPNGRTLDYVDV